MNERMRVRSDERYVLRLFFYFLKGFTIFSAFTSCNFISFVINIAFSSSTVAQIIASGNFIFCSLRRLITKSTISEFRYLIWKRASKSLINYSSSFDSNGYPNTSIYVITETAYCSSSDRISSTFTKPLERYIIVLESRKVTFTTHLFVLFAILQDRQSFQIPVLCYLLEAFLMHF